MSPSTESQTNDPNAWESLMYVSAQARRYFIKSAKTSTMVRPWGSLGAYPVGSFLHSALGARPNFHLFSISVGPLIPMLRVYQSSRDHPSVSAVSIVSKRVASAPKARAFPLASYQIVEGILELFRVWPGNLREIIQNLASLQVRGEHTEARC